MVKISGNDFNNSKFFNAKFIGNTSGMQNNVYQDVDSARKQTSGEVDSTNRETLDQYADLYSKLITKHGDYLVAIGTKEREYYKELTYNNGNGYIYKQYDELYGKLEARHNEFLKKLGVKDNVSSDVENTDTTNSSAYKDLTKTIGNLDRDIQKTISNTYALGMFFYKQNKDKDGKERRYAEELRDELEKGKKVTEDIQKEVKAGKQNDKETGKKQSVDTDKIVKGTMRLVDDVGSSLIQGKYTQRVFNDILKVIEIFQEQESLADSVVSLVLLAIKEATRWIGEGVADLHNTQEETYDKFGLYLARSEKSSIQTALYNNYMEDKMDLLYGLGLENNIKSTEWWKAQVGMLEKGFSGDQSYYASLQSVLLNKIAPALDTNNQYFMDLQQQGMFELTKSMGGLVEAVRDTAGSSRVTMGSLGTIVDKLAPVELYAKKELLGKGATAILSALENSGMATADAIELLSSATGVVSSPYSALTGGNTLERIAVAQGAYGGLDTAVLNMLNNYAMFTGGVKGSPINQGAVRSALGVNWGGDFANMPLIAQTVQEAYSEAMASEETKTGSEAYEDIKALFIDDILTTGEKQTEILASNNIVANDINGLLQEIALNIAFITDILSKTFNVAHDVMAKGTTDDFVKGIGETTDKKKKSVLVSKALLASATDDRKYLGIGAGGVIRGGWDIIEGIKNKNAGQVVEGVGGLFTQGVSYLPTDALDILGDDYKIYKAIKNSDFGGYDAGVGTTGKSTAQLVQEGYVYDTATGQWVKKYGTGGYVRGSQLAIVGDNPYGEIISPIPELSQAVMRGVNLSNKNSKPDTSSVETVIIQATEKIVKAIAENGGLVLDTGSGLMSGDVTSLNSKMRRGSR